MKLDLIDEKRGGKKLLEQPSEVIKRWVRIKMIRKGKILAEKFMRIRLTMKERKREKALEDTFEAIKKQAIKLENSPYESSKTFINIAFYFILAERDIQSIKIDALTHPDPWERNLALRMILLTIHEWDIGKITGKNLKASMETVGISYVLQQKVVSSLRKVRNAQERAKREFSYARNSIIAHRESNALSQYRTIRNMNTQTVFKSVIEFYEGAHQFIDVLPNLIAEGGNIASLLKQLHKYDKTHN